MRRPCSTLSNLLNGFSTGDPPAPANETDVAEHMYAFCKTFCSLWYASRLYIFGESYAGCIPGMARKIYLENEK
jgi:carboxypeptidase C (cathepsin A)